MLEKPNSNNNSNNSIVDEFNRNKIIYKKIKFKETDINFLWKCFILTFKKTFKINRDLKLGLKFNLKIKGVFTNYEIEIFDEVRKILQIKWNNGEDRYWMKFYLRKKLFFFSGHVIKITEHIYRLKPFWGLQDTAGMMWLKRNFKQEMNKMKDAIEIVLKNNGEIPDSFENYNTVKIIKKTFFIKNDNLNILMLIRKMFDNDKVLFEKKIFTSKLNKHSIIYNLKIENEKEGNISWEQETDTYLLKFKIEKNKIKSTLQVTSFWNEKSRFKYRLIKKNFKDFIKNGKNNFLASK